MPNGKLGDSPLSDLTIHGINRFPEDIKDLLLRIDELGSSEERWPLGENWPFGMSDFDWAEGRNLEEGRKILRHYIAMLEAGRGDEIMIDPVTQKPIRSTHD